MNRYKVIVTPEAEAGIRESFRYIYDQSPQHAERWIRDLYSEITILEHFPERCAAAVEREYLEGDFRQLLFASHRVVFYVDKKLGIVFVVDVRHARRRAGGQPELEEAEDCRTNGEGDQ